MIYWGKVVGERLGEKWREMANNKPPYPYRKMFLAPEAREKDFLRKGLNEKFRKC